MHSCRWTGFDYHLAWFGPGDWANYTRVYPTGGFHIYLRSAGFGAYSMFLDQVVSGAGTTNQVLSSLGQWNAVGRDNQTHAWVLLTDNLGAPALVKLGGLGTLRLSTTTGFCYPNYFMLVPRSGAAELTITAARSGGSILITIPTQAGATYRVLARDDLFAGDWALLTTVSGDGTAKPVSDPISHGRQRFYKSLTP